MKLLTGLELLFWFLAMITRIHSNFNGKEKQQQQSQAEVNQPTLVQTNRKERKRSNAHKRRSIILKTTKFGSNAKKRSSITIKTTRSQKTSSINPLYQ